jgi:hypothetical protein
LGYLIVFKLSGETFLVVGTNSNVVRVFTPAGQQKLVFSVPGTLITTASHLRKFAVVYSQGQDLSYSLYNMLDTKKNVYFQLFAYKGFLFSVRGIFLCQQERN